MLKFETKCRFCEKVTGSIELPALYPTPGLVLTNENLAIEDVRCSECQEEKGVYNEMELVATNQIGMEHAEFKELMERSGHDVNNFTKIVITEHPEKTLVGSLVGVVETKKQEALAELGLAEKETEVQMRSVIKAKEEHRAETFADLKNNVSKVVAGVETEVRNEKIARIEKPE